MRNLPSTPLSERLNKLLTEAAEGAVLKEVEQASSSTHIETYLKELPCFVHHPDWGWQLAFKMSIYEEAEDPKYGMIIRINWQTITNEPAGLLKPSCKGDTIEDTKRKHWMKRSNEVWKDDPTYFSNIFQDHEIASNIYAGFHKLFSVAARCKIKNKILASDVREVKGLPATLVKPFLEELLKMDFNWADLCQTPALTELSLRQQTPGKKSASPRLKI